MNTCNAEVTEWLTAAERTERYRSGQLKHYRRRPCKRKVAREGDLCGFHAIREALGYWTPRFREQEAE